MEQILTGKKPALSTLISDFYSLQDCKTINLFKPPNLRYFVTIALVNE